MSQKNKVLECCFGVFSQAFNMYDSAAILTINDQAVTLQVFINSIQNNKVK